MKRSIILIPVLAIFASACSASDESTAERPFTTLESGVRAYVLGATPGSKCEAGQTGLGWDDAVIVENLMRCVDGRFEERSSASSSRADARREEERAEESAIRRISIELTGCDGSGPDGVRPAMVTGTVHNGSDRVADVSLLAFIESDGLRVGEGGDFVQSLRPGKTAVFEAGILSDTSGGEQVRCFAEIDNVYLD